MERFLNLHSIFHLDEFLTGWFLGSPAEEIPRKNVEEFVAYGFFCRTVEALDPEEQTAVEDFVAAVEKKWDMDFPPGYDSSLRFMAHVWEPLRVQHKLLIVYAVTELAARIAHLLLRWMGFSKGQQGAFTSWTSPPMQYHHHHHNGTTTGTGTTDLQGTTGTTDTADGGTGTAAGTTSGTTGAGTILGTTVGSSGPQQQLQQHRARGEIISTPASGTPRATHAAHVREVAHNAAEHFVDAAVAATSAAAAAATKQYPHEGQQYHLPPPERGLPSYPIITTFREISGFLARRVALPEASPRRRRVRSNGGLPTRDSANSVDFDAELHRRTPSNNLPPEGQRTSSLGANLVAPGDGGGAPSTQQQPITIATRSSGLPIASDVPAAGGGASRVGRGGIPLQEGANTATAATTNKNTTVPVVFLHGVGFGTLPYLYFVRNMMKACPQSPFILLEMPHVALRLCKEAESVDDVAAAAVAVVHSLGVRHACFVGHSYGTFCVSRIVQLFPEAVHSTALLDPVCMLTCYPQLLFNFIYRTISRSALTSVVAAIDGVRFLCSRDLTISQAFCRLFHWSELMLWPEDLPRKRHHSLVVLSGKDDLVPGMLVQSQFEAAEHPATVMYHPELGHGGLLLNDAWMKEVVAGVRRMVHRKEEEDVREAREGRNAGESANANAVP